MSVKVGRGLENQRKRDKEPYEIRHLRIVFSTSIYKIKQCSGPDTQNPGAGFTREETV